MNRRACAGLAPRAEGCTCHCICRSLTTVLGGLAWVFRVKFSPPENFLLQADSLTQFLTRITGPSLEASRVLRAGEQSRLLISAPNSLQFNLPLEPLVTCSL